MVVSRRSINIFQFSNFTVEDAQWKKGQGKTKGFRKQPE
jgi:hypothetical protein